MEFKRLNLAIITATKSILMICSVTLLITISPIVQSSILSFEFNDPAGDATRVHGTDVTRIKTVFDNATGHYTITLFTAPGKPFEDRFRINLNMINPDTSEFTVEQSLFFDNSNDFDDHPVSATITLTGTNDSLLHWKAGDQVALSSEPFGIPGDSELISFHSGMTDYSTFWEASSDEFPLNEVAIIGAVPLPAAAWLFGSGLIGLISVANRKKV